MNKLLLLGCGCLLSVFACLAEVLVVPDDYPSIQEAITASVPGDTVLVKEGTYNELINFMGKDIIVGSLFFSTGDSSYIGQTIISAPSQGSVVTFANGETSAALLTGFTITNGTGTVENGGLLMGGGIYVKNASPTLDHLYVVYNVAGGMGGNGGGIYFNNSTSLVTDCLISNNEASRGGGIRLTEADVTLKSTWIRNNYAVAAGGGLMCYLSLHPQIDQCIFTGNQSAYGGAMSFYESHPLIDRTTVYDNHAITGSGINAESYSWVLLINSILWNNSFQPGVISEIHLTGSTNNLVVTYSDITGGMNWIINPDESVITWLEGNLDIDPEFTNQTGLDLTLDESSPCINAGTALFVYNGDTLVNITDYSGTAPDMGAYEHMEPVASDPLAQQRSQICLWVRPGNNEGESILWFTLPESMHISLKLTDMRGRVISLLADQTFPAGDQSVRIPSAGLSPGLYLATLISGNHLSSVKLLIE